MTWIAGQSIIRDSIEHAEGIGEVLAVKSKVDLGCQIKYTLLAEPCDKRKYVYEVTRRRTIEEGQ